MRQGYHVNTTVPSRVTCCPWTRRVIRQIYHAHLQRVIPWALFSLSLGYSTSLSVASRLAWKSSFWTAHASVDGFIFPAASKHSIRMSYMRRFLGYMEMKMFGQTFCLISNIFYHIAFTGPILQASIPSQFILFTKSGKFSPCLVLKKAVPQLRQFRLFLISLWVFNPFFTSFHSRAQHQKEILNPTLQKRIL